MIYRLEYLYPDLINGHATIDIILTSPFLHEVKSKMSELSLQKHFGIYQIIKEEFITNEHSLRNPTKDNKIQSEDSSSLPIRPSD